MLYAYWCKRHNDEGNSPTMTTYLVTPLINIGASNFTGFTPEHPLSYDPRLMLTVEADDVEAAGSAAFKVGNRMAADANGREWPSDVRSLSVGDVLVIEDRVLAIEPVGFADVDVEQADLRDRVAMVEAGHAR